MKRLVWVVLIAGAVLAVGFHRGKAAAQESPQASRGGQMQVDEPKAATKSLSPTTNAPSNAPATEQTTNANSAATKALELYRRAAENGDPTAQVQMARIYRNGFFGVDRDLAKAAEYLRKAAAQGDATALGLLGGAYRDGEGLAQDLEKAEALFWQAYAKDEALGGMYLSLLAHKYSKGDGVPTNNAKAIEIYKRGADMGSVGMQSALGNIHYQRASEAYRKVLVAAIRAAKTPPDFDKLDRDAINDSQVAQEYAAAAKWLCKAAEAGDASAQGTLGELFLGGKGVSEDHREGLRWLRRAANQGDTSGQWSLGKCYEEGKGVSQDFVEAYEWYNLALAQNLPSDVTTYWSKERNQLAEKMTPGQIAEAQRRSSAFVAKEEIPSSEEAPGTTPSADMTPKASGSGFFVTEDGCLLTSYHVVEGANRITLKTKQGTFAAKLVKADMANDVVLLKTEGKFPALPIAPSRGMKLGESVFTIGFPNIDLQGFAPKLTKGEISSLTGAQDDPREFQISVAVQPGNSGGPLVNQYGNVIGIVEARLSDIATLKSTGSLPQNVNYAVKSSLLNVLLESLPEVSAKLKEPNTAKDRKFEDVVKEAESATALVLVY